MTPHFEDDFLVARDGMRLPLREWNADGDAPKAVIVALHGMSDYSNAFDMPGTEWAKRGITTLAIDQRGFGKSDNPGLWAGGDVMRRDLVDFAAAAHARYPGVKIFAAGESMGGAVVLSALASANPPAVDGAILVSPAVSFSMTVLRSRSGRVIERWRGRVRDYAPLSTRCVVTHPTTLVTLSPCHHSAPPARRRWRKSGSARW